MLNTKNLQRGKKPERMSPFNIRLPKAIREKAQEMAKNTSSPENRLTETDIYRTAILLFFDSCATVSSEED